jgi:hypothetical protein
MEVVHFNDVPGRIILKVFLTNLHPSLVEFTCFFYFLSEVFFSIEIETLQQDLCSIKGSYFIPRRSIFLSLERIGPRDETFSFNDL